MATRSTLLLIIIVLIINSYAFSQSEIDDHSVYVLANLETLNPNSKEILSFEKVVRSHNGPYSIIIAGDFVGVHGWNSPPTEKQKSLIDKVISLAHSKGKLIFIPGDKEWKSNKGNPIKKVKKLEKYIESKMGKHKSFFPEDGCLGPEIYDISDHIRIVTVNSYWFMDDKRQDEEDGNCSNLSDREFSSELAAAISESDNRNIIVAVHHPIVSYGQYAGYKNESMHFKPPIIGTFRKAHRKHFGGDNGLNTQKYGMFKEKILSISNIHNGIIFTSGHEYDQQINFVDGNYHINSGSIAKGKPVASKKGTLFSSRNKGFTKLNFFKNGKASVQVLEFDDDPELSAKEAFSKTLFKDPCNSGNQDRGIYNNTFIPCLEKIDINEYQNNSFPESGTGIASLDYNIKKSEKFWLGKMYRSTWAEPVKNIPYLDVKTKEGGLIPYARGGSGETTSLKFKTKDGRKFSFRSVDKNPQRKIAEEVQNTAIGNITKDLTSHQHPYGGIIASEFLNALDLPHSDPQLYLMPDDPNLGIYREEFAGMLGTYEIKPVGKKKKRKGFLGADNVVGTFDMFNKIINDHDARIEKEGYLKSRLFDIWTGDWDRHEYNWKWLEYKKDGQYTYKVFPKDKDKVFAILEGLYAVIDWEIVSPTMASFRKDYRGPKSLNFKSRNMDHWLLSSLTEQDWQDAVKDFQNAISDQVIEKALKRMPAEAYDLTSDQLRKRMISRRDMLSDGIKKYYKLLVKNIFVVGTNDKEFFQLKRLADGNVQVDVFKMHKDGEKEDPIYSRLVKQKETDEIIVYGLGKKDIIEITGKAENSINLRIIGGKGSDVIQDNSTVNGGKSTFIYDKKNKDKITLGTEAKVVKTLKEVKFSSQTLFDFDYNVALPILGFNTDDGFIGGFSYSTIKRGFGKKEFARKSSFVGSFTSNLHFNFNYETKIRRANSSWDLELGIGAINNNKDYQKFYGYGNENNIDPVLDLNGYYRNKTSRYSGFIGFEKMFWERSSFRPKFKIEYIDVQPNPTPGNQETFYDGLTEAEGLGNSTLIGTEMELDIDLTNNKFIPTSGVRFNVLNNTFYNANADIGLGGRIDSEATVYTSVGSAKPITLSVRAGYSYTYGDAPFYYKSTLGQQANNKGFTRNRFAGDSVAFINTELRFHLGSVRTSLIPIKYGIFGLYDSGRVWYDNDVSKEWYYSYGGGFYIVPWQDAFTIEFSYAISDEKNAILNFVFGTRF